MVILWDIMQIWECNDSSCCHALVDSGKVATGRHMFGMSFSINNQRWIRGTGTWHSHWIKNHLSSVQNPSGWWFGTFFIFPYIGNFIIPTEELIFFRGVGLNHQPPLAGLMISGIILTFIYWGFFHKSWGSDQSQWACDACFVVRNGAADSASSGGQPKSNVFDPGFLEIIRTYWNITLVTRYFSLGFIRDTLAPDSSGFCFLRLYAIFHWDSSRIL